MAADPAVRVSVPAVWGDVVGAVLMELLGPFQEWDEGGSRHLLFYPFRYGAGFVSDADLRAAVPDDRLLQDALVVERVLVPGGWEEGWKDHFKPLTVGRLYVRPPWEDPPLALPADVVGAGSLDPAVPDGVGAALLLDVCLTPGLAFGTGLHATTRGVLGLMQDDPVGGPLVDAGTGSGILAVAGARLGYEPVCAFDNDPLAVDAARSNADANGVEVWVQLADVRSAPGLWFAGATVLANMTLEPVRELLERLSAEALVVNRVLAAGILSGDQETQVLRAASAAGLRLQRSIYDAEWVAFDLRPVVAAPGSREPIAPAAADDGA